MAGEDVRIIVGAVLSFVSTMDTVLSLLPLSKTNKATIATVTANKTITATVNMTRIRFRLGSPQQEEEEGGGFNDVLFLL